MTALYLLGGVAIGLALALPIGAIPVPGAPHIARNVLSGLVLLGVIILAGRAWGRALAERAGADPDRPGRMAALGFASATISVAVVLGLLEPVFARAGAARGIPIHVVYGLLFVPAAALVAGVSAFALQRALEPRTASLRRVVETSGAAGVAFLAVDILMDTVGWRVGGPAAAERATMLVVTLFGCLAAALAGGAMLARGLVGRPRPEPSSESHALE